MVKTQTRSLFLDRSSSIVVVKKNKNNRSRKSLSVSNGSVTPLQQYVQQCNVTKFCSEQTFPSCTRYVNLQSCHPIRGCPSLYVVNRRVSNLPGDRNPRFINDQRFSLADEGNLALAFSLLLMSSAIGGVFGGLTLDVLVDFPLPLASSSSVSTSRLRQST